MIFMKLQYIFFLITARPREPQTELDRFMDLMDLYSSSDEEEPDPGLFMLHNQCNYIIYVTLSV